MAKEMMIMFVYDTELKKEESDDISDSVLYFHPHWVPGEQKFALCGQIVGTVQCLKAMFKCPSIISLQSGKFAIREFGRFILAIGTDRNIADWVVEYRSSTLCNLINFYHNDLDVMYQQYQDRSKFTGKLYHIFETYLRILIYGGNMFSNIPTIQLPKSASNVFLEASQILQCCQEMDYVLGGTMLYHNKVVSSQLSANLTKKLVLTDPYRIKSPAEIAVVDFQLPLGVQLLQVYVQREDYQDLLEDSTKCRTIFQYLNKKNIHKKPITKATPTKETVMTAMKRDQSIIFSTVPEEDSEHHPPLTESKIITAKTQNRPKFLNLRSKTTDIKTETKPELNTVPNTPFYNQTSICSTPMTDLSKVLHENVMSICVNPETAKAEVELFSVDSQNSTEHNLDNLEKKKSDRKKSICAPFMTVTDDTSSLKKWKSTSDLCEEVRDCKEFSKFKFQLDSPVKENKCKSIKTITDPTFPVFRFDGSIISESLYEYYVNKHVNTLNAEFTANGVDDKVNKMLEDFDTIEVEIKDDVSAFPEKNAKTTREEPIEILLMSRIPEGNVSKQESRKSLSLPLKSLSNNDAEENSPVIRPKYTGGVQLTPLISKLSMVASEDRSSGFCSRATTPSEYKDYIFTPTSSMPFLNSKLMKQKESKYRTKVTEDLHKAVLFVCGQQDMVVTVLLEEQGCSSPHVINKLWETCTEYLGKLERQLRQCLEMYPGSNQSDNGEPYSYLCMDPHWDTTERGGPWGGTELGALTHLHRDFNNMRNLTEIILRDDESIIYGHHCGKNEIFYHQTVSSNAGIPTPADPMGVVPLKAKRRLERDHSIMLL